LNNNNVAEEELASPPHGITAVNGTGVFYARSAISPVIINKNNFELFLLEQHNRPKYIMLFWLEAVVFFSSRRNGSVVVI
jgi:hypothetical protein